MISGPFGERAAQAKYAAETQYSMQDGVLVGQMPSDGDIASIVSKLEQVTAGVMNARRVLDEKGDQVFGAIPTVGTPQAATDAPLGGIARIFERLDSLSSEVDSLNHSARRFERL